MEDICDTQNGFQFLFGQAQLDKGVGIFSFARYADDSPSPARFLKRCGMVLVHEAFHLFGVKHCVFALCIMNGSNHLDESERRPFAMCPVDLRKLASTLDDSKIYSQPVDLEQRERSLLDFFEKHGLDDDARFTRGNYSTDDGPGYRHHRRTGSATVWAPLRPRLLELGVASLNIQ